ncbi:spermatogenesis-associated serine-rich protein 1-like [Babylonia areolata]|uniref:spermatogenesis-associated serine-rich protein 1-like n=1 Tax=Babylonia areolata TaxID=304850 RepID=UPI003FD48293
MLHVTTEVGKVGKKERERRHFPLVHNQNSAPAVHNPRGRRYIPHNYGTDIDWVPHGQYIEPQPTEAGPDWSSRLRYIPDPENPDYPAAEIWPNNWRSMRPYPWTYKRSDNEWLLDPGLTKVGLRCMFSGEHKATATSENEITHTMLFGKGRSEAIMDKRNEIPEASPGDKSYQAPEYSPSFHKLGSTLPVTRYGPARPVRSPDTFIPLTPLTNRLRETFKERDNSRQLQQEIDEVRRLEAWKPATPLPQTLPPVEDKK